MPRPVHSALLRIASSRRTFPSRPAVELAIWATVALNSSAAPSATAVTLAAGLTYGQPYRQLPAPEPSMGGRGMNQLWLKSKKQRSAQWHDVRNRMTSRKLQYTHGRERKKVHTKKRKTNTGGALVGMKRRGSQLCVARVLA